MLLKQALSQDPDAIALALRAAATRRLALNSCQSETDRVQYDGPCLPDLGLSLSSQQIQIEGLQRLQHLLGLAKVHASG